ncbi:calcium/sodium antiporter [Hydrogenophaga pseudoflava]|uniref:Inner membrane protein YrbG n=1 Tax=Hydrogenophaga pseudoflava TaxID=47421 RepID=A0A4P6WXX3_HYDPS|nr:calcium/sodium antiporter [Hydrogenophaga pseudoflava]QBM26124.1 Inner membrane protein YrbG [Hydrogenophaga pseudoflava]
MALHPALLFLGGLVVVVLGAEMLLRGATRIATLLRISPIVIGLTVVSVGTSAPELAVGLTAAHEGKGPLAVGNIAGTNIVNILLILGLSAAIRPLPTRSLSVRLDVPVMIATAVALLVMAMDGVLTRAEGLGLLLAAVVYTVALVQLSRQEAPDTRLAFRDALAAQAPPRVNLPTGAAAWAWNGALLLAGMALAVLGAELLVAGAVELAKAYGVSDAFIGLSIVAIGTSAPELVTTMISTLRNDRDVAIGNLIGSSIYNVLVILGLTMVAAPTSGVDVSAEVLWIDLPLAALVAIVCLPVFRSDRLVSRREGIGFVLAYAAYLGSLLLWRT